MLLKCICTTDMGRPAYVPFLRAVFVLVRRVHKVGFPIAFKKERIIFLHVNRAVAYFFVVTPSK